MLLRGLLLRRVLLVLRLCAGPRVDGLISRHHGGWRDALVLREGRTGRDEHCDEGEKTHGPLTTPGWFQSPGTIRRLRRAWA